MSYVRLSEVGSRWFTPLSCGPCSPELSNSCSANASKLHPFTLTQESGCSPLHHLAGEPFQYMCQHGESWTCCCLGCYFACTVHGDR